MIPPVHPGEMLLEKSLQPLGVSPSAFPVRLGGSILCLNEVARGKRAVTPNGALLAWGSDLVWKGGGWSNARARGYRPGARVRDPLQLRLNAYGVLLTRGRDGTVVFVPPLAELDATHERLVAAGLLSLDTPLPL